MHAIEMYPWISGPLIAREGVLRFATSVVPMGAFTTLLVDGVRRYGVAFALAVSGALLVMGVVSLRLWRSSSPARSHFEVPQSETSQSCDSAMDVTNASLGETRELQ